MATNETQNTSYRRGLVLGLTLAEIAILIIFVLLLAFAALLASQRDKRKEAEQVAEARQDTIILLQKQFSTIHELLPYGEKNIEELKRELVVLRETKQQLAKFQDAAQSSGFSPEPEAIKNALESAREYENLKSAIQERLPDGEMNIGELERELVSLSETKQQLAKFQDAAQSSGFSPEPEAIKNALESAREYENLKSEGKGTEMPSCWTREDGTIEYIYEVNLTPTGLVVWETTDVSTHRVDERQTLPVEKLSLKQDISEASFLSATSDLFEWSKSKKCRFFVRVFDSTGPTEKAIYQSRLRTVEAHFYKLISSEAF